MKEVRAVDVAAEGYGSVAILFENDAGILVEILRCGVIDNLRDAEAVAVIDILDNGAVLGDGADQLVT